MTLIWAILMGCLFGILSGMFFGWYFGNKNKPTHVGDMIVTKTDEKTLFNLELGVLPEALEFEKSVEFTVKVLDETKD